MQLRYSVWRHPGSTSIVKALYWIRCADRVVLKVLSMNSRSLIYLVVLKTVLIFPTLAKWIFRIYYPHARKILKFKNEGSHECDQKCIYKCHFIEIRRYFFQNFMFIFIEKYIQDEILSGTCVNKNPRRCKISKKDSLFFLPKVKRGSLERYFQKIPRAWRVFWSHLPFKDGI